MHRKETRVVSAGSLVCKARRLQHRRIMGTSWQRTADVAKRDKGSHGQYRRWKLCHYKQCENNTAIVVAAFSVVAI